MRTATRLLATTWILALEATQPVPAQTKLVGWGSSRFDSAWADDAFVEAEANVYATIARRADGTIAAWGLAAGPLLDVPAIAPGLGIVDLALRGSTSTALLSDGSAMSWPNSEFLDFGAPIVQLSAGRGHMLVLLATGSVHVVGDNTYGQAYVPSLPPGTTYVEVAAGSNHSLVRRSDGVVISFGSMTGTFAPPPGRSFVQLTGGWYHSAALLDDGTITAWGVANQAGQLDVPPLPPGLTYVKCDAGPGHTLALRSDGSVVGWGSNVSGQTNVPPLPPGTTYVDISAGGQSTPGYGASHNALRRSDGALVVFGWNGYRQLNAPALPAGVEYVQIEASGVTPDLGGPLTYSHEIALRSDGSVVVSGDLTYGQGNVPALPPGVTYVEVDAGGLHNVARRSNGTIVAWGNNSWGQLNGIPILPPGITWVGIAASAYHSLGLRSDGIVHGWGYSGAPLNAPALAPGTGYVQVDAGLSHSLARRSDGAIVAWGSNTYGQLDVPALPPGVTYVDVSAGGYHSLARRSDGAVVGWGWNYYGQATPPPLPTGVVFAQVSAGPNWSAGLTSTGEVVTWGNVPGGPVSTPELAPGQRFKQIAAGYIAVVGLVDTLWTPYGTGKTNSLGCVPDIGASGIPSATAGAGFPIDCELVRNQTVGILMYTVNGAPASTPFQCGTRLVGPTGIRRTPIRGAGGSALPAADCSGVFVLDMNAFAAGAAGGVPDPLLSVAGTVVHAQWWGRDNGYSPPCNSMLSNALTYAIGP